MEENISNDISSESTHQTHSPKVIHTPRDGLYQSCSKNCEISNFDFFFVFNNIGPHRGKSLEGHLL